VPTDKRRIRVLVAESHPLLVEGLRAVLARRSQIEVVGVAFDGAAAVRLARETKPDLVLVSVAMPGIDGVEVTRIIRRVCPNTRIIGLESNTHVEDRRQREMARAGAAGYLLGRCEPDTVLEAIDVVARGEQYFRQHEASPTGGRTQPEPPHLSRRELEVIRLVAEGRSNKLIADDLGIGVRTVETHRERVMRKLGVQGTAGLTKWAVLHGLVDPAS
jgi:two-component system nitrate/nitrite response regulator NarL